jgi:hypothetical protein
MVTCRSLIKGIQIARQTRIRCGQPVIKSDIGALSVVVEMIVKLTLLTEFNLLTELREREARVTYGRPLACRR